MLLHQLGEDFVLALEFGLEVGDLLVLGARLPKGFVERLDKSLELIKVAK
jgi:hypothetical protein